MAPLKGSCRGITNMAPLEGSCRRKATEGCALATLLYKAISVLSAYSMLIYFVHPLLLDWITSAANYFGIIMTVKKVTLAYVLLVCGAQRTAHAPVRQMQHSEAALHGQEVTLYIHLRKAYTIHVIF